MLEGKGAIAVDTENSTNVPNILAGGDVTDRVKLTPVAIREGHSFADSQFGGKPWRVDYTAIPSAVFSNPPLGSVGLTEEQAREQEPVEVYSATFRPIKTLFAGCQDRVLMKLVCRVSPGQGLGRHIIPPDAGEFLQVSPLPLLQVGPER